ncbi:oxidoreductase C-terminal domain-containing protein [Nonomuraea dietziae]|uniref:oxidoreductase C-terminal domain-containing protein n=1 Tax=Nonomuraea dietziae TaxID=65515 RepID=UPI0031DB75ED
MRPTVEWLAGSDIDLHNGVVTDEHLRASLPNVVAVGDCAAWWSRRFHTRLRVEHWGHPRSTPPRSPWPACWATSPCTIPFRTSGRSSSATWCSTRVTTPGPAWCAAGRPRRAAAPVSRWSVCWLHDDDRLAAVLTVNRPRDLVQGRRLIRGRPAAGPRAPGRSRGGSP